MKRRRDLEFVGVGCVVECFVDEVRVADKGRIRNDFEEPLEIRGVAVGAVVDGWVESVDYVVERGWGDAGVGGFDEGAEIVVVLDEGGCE